MQSYFLHGSSIVLNYRRFAERTNFDPPSEFHLVLANEKLLGQYGSLSLSVKLFFYAFFVKFWKFTSKRSDKQISILSVVSFVDILTNIVLF